MRVDGSIRGIEELVISVWFCLAVVTSFISHYKSIVLLLQYKQLYLVTGAEFLLFLFYVNTLQILLVQSGAPLLVSENILLCADIFLREL